MQAHDELIKVSLKISLTYFTLQAHVDFCEVPISLQSAQAHGKARSEGA